MGQAKGNYLSVADTIDMIRRHGSVTVRTVAAYLDIEYDAAYKRLRLCKKLGLVKSETKTCYGVRMIWRPVSDKMPLR